MMASTFIAENSGFIHLVNPKHPFRIQSSTGAKFASSNTIRLVSGRISGRHDWCLILAHTHIKCAASSGRNQQELRFSEDEYRSEPFWLPLIKEAVWALRSLLVFLVGQPGQLKYIEWPSFQSTDKREAKVQLRPEIQEVGFHGGVGMQGGHGLELDLEFKPIEHPVEPPDEDRPVKCPMPGSSVPNEERFAESLRKRVELSSDMNEEGMLVMAIEPPARAVRKRHHTLTRNHSMPPLFRRTPLPPIPTQNTTIFQMLQQCNEYESCQDIQY